MVDALVSLVVRRLGNFVTEEAAFCRGVKDDVAWLKRELEVMQRFLKDAEEKQFEDAITCGWVSDIRDLAYDIEDLLVTFQLKSRCFPSMCSCIFDKGKKLVNLCHIGKKIKKLKETASELSSRRQRYKLQDSGSSRDGKGSDLLKSKELRKTNSFAVEENVVGFQDDADQLLTKLLENEPRRFIISIFGMGGLGKTTLARKLYHRSEVEMKFNRRAWVSVSQDYTAQDLLVRIIISFGITGINLNDLQKMDEVDLGRHLHESLREYSYLVVMDDVWNKEVWKSLKRYFPDNEKGSRVIITTRNQEVAECSDERTHSHNLRKLRSDESWQLFCEKVSAPYFNANDQLQNLGREMVQKCDGLPLAIVVLAGLLSHKQAHEWCEVRNHLWQHLKVDAKLEIHCLLTLSFDCLSYPLKQCFLYLGLFPEDFEIKVGRLIHLLVAEGFIPEVEGHIMEEVAKAYVDELISRSLIQVARRYWGRIATCRVHDLLRDLLIDKAKSFNFLCIYDRAKHSNILSTLSSYRRLAIYFGVENPLWFKNCNPGLRSLSLFAQGQKLVRICKEFKSLRVLNIDGHNDSKEIQKLVKDTGKLIHLKYLGLGKSWSLFYRLSISKLRSLQIVYACGVIDLPAEICKLQELRHLIGAFAYLPLQIDNLTKLQTLKYVGAHQWSQIKTANLVNLRELQITDSDFGWNDSEGGVFSFNSMSNLKSLRILSVALGRNMSFASLQPLSHCQYLIELTLREKLEKLPTDIHKLLPNLQLLSLTNSQLEDDPMPLLEKLPCLSILHLAKGFYNGKKIMCSDNGFPLLEVLLFDENDFEIEEWQVGKEALPRLKGLRIPENIKLTIPEKLRSLPTPDPLEYTNMSPNEALYHL